MFDYYIIMVYKNNNIKFLSFRDWYVLEMKLALWMLAVVMGPTKIPKRWFEKKRNTRDLDFIFKNNNIFYNKMENTLVTEFMNLFIIIFCFLFVATNESFNFLF